MNTFELRIYTNEETSVYRYTLRSCARAAARVPILSFVFAALLNFCLHCAYTYTCDYIADVYESRALKGILFGKEIKYTHALTKLCRDKKDRIQFFYFFITASVQVNSSKQAISLCIYTHCTKIDICFFFYSEISRSVEFLDQLINNNSVKESMVDFLLEKGCVERIIS